jgi:hypothetical protein
MQDLVDKVAAAANLDAETAHKAVRVVLAFIAREAPEDKVKALFDAMPGAREMVENEGEGGFPDAAGFGGMGAMATFNELSGLGLSFSQIKVLAQELLAYGRAKAGEDVMGEIVAAIPGLDQLL